MKKKTHRQVLGVGYPWFVNGSKGQGFSRILLVDKKNGTDEVNLKIGELGAYKKIKLIAEYVK